MVLDSQLKIGIDFDNTIVCYEHLVHTLALETGLIKASISKNKTTIRDYFRANDLEHRWTELQAELYGPRISEATIFPEVKENISRLKSRGVSLYIISHKTKNPYKGPQYDLHAYAWDWLYEQGIVDDLIPRSNIFFELTKKAKLERISALGCDYFVDDLPELLLDTDFPKNTKPILFDPNANYLNEPLIIMRDWQELTSLLK